MPTNLPKNTCTANIANRWGGKTVYVDYDSRLKLDDPDGNTYSTNDPDDIFCGVPPLVASSLV